MIWVEHLWTNVYYKGGLKKPYSFTETQYCFEKKSENTSERISTQFFMLWLPKILFSWAVSQQST